MWLPDQLTNFAATGLNSKAQALAAEQSVRGLDALSETGFHPILAEAFAASGLGVIREQPYPGEVERRPRHAERERCDLVLCPTPGIGLIDPVARLKAADCAGGTLFAEVAASLIASERGIDPADAFWLEVKAVGQYCYTKGIPGPNRAYSSELLHIAGSDIPKLSKERLIRWCGILLILFHESEDVALHDVNAFMHRCLDKDLPVLSPSIRGFDIQDRIGNHRCTVMLAPVRPAAV